MTIIRYFEFCNFQWSKMMVMSAISVFFGLFSPETRLLFVFSREQDLNRENTNNSTNDCVTPIDLRPFMLLYRKRCWCETALIVPVSDKDYRLFMNFVLRRLSHIFYSFSDFFWKWSTTKIRDARRIFTNRLRDIASSWRIAILVAKSVCFFVLGTFFLIFSCFRREWEAHTGKREANWRISISYCCCLQAAEKPLLLSQPCNSVFGVKRG